MTNKPLDAAKDYIKRGWAVVPVPPGEKGAKMAHWQDLRLDEKQLTDHFQPDSNVGIILGDASGGLTDIDLDVPEAIHCAHRILPATLKSGRGRNVGHIWFVSPGSSNQKFKDLDGSVLLEIRHDKHQTVVEPSIHPSGDEYKWTNSLKPKEISPDQLKDECCKVAAATLIARHLPPSGRHDLALSLAGFLLKRLDGSTVTEILESAWSAKGATSEAVKDLNQIVQDTQEKIENDEPHTGGKTLDEFLPGLRQKIGQWFGWKGGQSGEDTDYSDYGNGQLLVGKYGEDIKYVYEWKKWAYWTGKRWAKDEIGYVKHLGTEAIKSLYLEARTLPSDEGKRTLKHAVGSLANGKVTAMLEMARATPGMTISADAFDTQDHLLNCENGTLDLRNNQLLPHNKHDFITRLVPVPYRPKAKATRFTKFLTEILPDPEVLEFVHKAIGYSLTGETSERSLFIAQGPGNNGKSTLLNACADVLGDYAARANAEVFLEKPAGSIPNDVAQLKGPRLVLASEVEQGKRLSEAQVKNFTGGSDKLSARFLYGEHFEFYPKFTAWILTNPLPRIKGTDPAIWNRLKIIPFHTVPSKIDLTLSQQLKREGEGILAWMIQGYRDYQQYGLKSPVAVEQMKDYYRTDQDAVARFVAEICLRGSQYNEGLDDLFDAFKEWAVDSEEWKLSKNRFSGRLDDLGCDTVTVARKTHKTTIKLREEDDGGPGDSPEPPAVGQGTILSATRAAKVNAATNSDPGGVAETAGPSASLGGAVVEATVQHEGGGVGASEKETPAQTSPVLAQEAADTTATGKTTLESIHESLQSPSGPIRSISDIRAESGELDVWAIDTETTGLNPRSDRVRVLSLFNPHDGEPQAYDLDESYALAKSEFQRVLDSGKPAVFHNAAFDLAFLERLFPGTQERLRDRVWDTMVLSQLAYAGRVVEPLTRTQTGHGLDACANRELGIYLDKSEQASDWSGVLSHAQLEYAAGDTALLPKLLARLAGVLKEVGVADEIVELEMKLLVPLTRMTDRGIKVDVDGWRRKAEESEQEMVGAEIALENRLLELMGDDEEFTSNEERVREVNWGSPKQVQEIMADVNVWLEDTKDSTLANSEDSHGLFDLLRTHRSASKLLKSYGEKWLENVDRDGFVHPQWKQTTTATGRMACANPNIQQIPATEDFRSLFTAREGYKFVVADYSQIELRIAAKIANEPVMLKAYREGQDIHTLTASQIVGKRMEQVTKDDRRLAKAVNFGLLYGMGAPRLQQYARTAYGVTLNDAEARKYRNRWLDTYKWIRSWHQREGAKLDAAKTNSYNASGAIRTIAGRVRGDVDLYTERLNTPVQGSGADGLKAALLQISRIQDFHPVAVVHDEVVVEVPADGKEHLYQEQIEGIMVREMEKYIEMEGRYVPVVVEGTVSDRWEK